MMKDEQDSGPLEIFEDTSNSDSYGASFDRSSYVVVRTDSDPQQRQRHGRTSAVAIVQNRRRCGSIGEDQPEFKKIETTSPRAYRGGSTFHAPFGDLDFVMVERYKSMKRLPARDNAEFLDGSEFLSSDNVFRGSPSSIERGRVKRSSSHKSAASSSIDVDHIENIFQQLHTSLNATDKQGKQNEHSTRGVRHLSIGDSPFMKSPKVHKGEDETEPTTPSTPPVSKSKKKNKEEKKRKKAPKKHKKRMKEQYALQPVIPPPEIHVSSQVTVASSIGGLEQFRHPKHCEDDRHQRPTLDLYVAKQNSFTEINVSQPMTVASSLGPYSAIHHHKHKASASRPATRVGLLPRRPTVQHIKAPQDKVPLESILQSPRVIDVSDPTIVSALTEHVRPTPNRRPPERTRNHY